MDTKIAEYCQTLRRELGIKGEPLPGYDPWNTVEIRDKGPFCFYDKRTPFALYGFRDMISAESARKLGIRKDGNAMNGYLVGVFFRSALSEKAMRKHIAGKRTEAGALSECVKRIPVKRCELFRNFDINGDGLFETELENGYLREFRFFSDEIPLKGTISFPLRIRLNGKFPVGPVSIRASDGRHFSLVEISYDDMKYVFSAPTSHDEIERQPIEIGEWRVREDDESVYIDVLLTYEFW